MRSCPPRRFSSPRINDASGRVWARLLTVSAALAAAIPAPAAADAPSTKVVQCGTRNCLEISGERQDSRQIVSVNQRTVAAEGDRNWRVYLPVETVRAWSDPHARAIEVSLADPLTRQEQTAIVRLPVGLLGGVELSALVVTVN